MTPFPSTPGPISRAANRGVLTSENSRAQQVGLPRVLPLTSSICSALQITTILAVYNNVQLISYGFRGSGAAQASLGPLLWDSAGSNPGVLQDRGPQ